MILNFPDLDTLRLVLTSGAAPPAVAQAAAVVGFDDQNRVWVETAASLPRAAQNDLRRLGVQLAKTSGAAETFAVRCWPEILPLQRDADPLDRLEQTPILFETAGQDDLGRLVVEILRLGNDRQQFRWLESKTDADDGRGLLRVVGPPYYSLLRAIDRGGQAAPRAYRERAPRVWVEVGWVHPLADHLKPPAGKMLLAAAPRQWTLIDEAPFRDVYEVMEFALPDGPTDWNEGALKDKVRAALRLTAGGAAEGAELWVLRDDPVGELNRFVQNSDDQMLHRLAFAVGEKDGRTVVVLRTRHSRLPPPELVLKAEAYKTYLKLPNLFLPAGRALHPPLRRDMVRRLLADDPAQVVWLAPAAVGGFRPETLPEDAFRPLIDWVDYVLDHEKEPLTAWVQAAQFDFEAFVCDEDLAAKPKKPPAPPERKRGKKKDGGDDGGTDAAAGPTVEYVDKSRRNQDKAEDETFTIEKVEPSELQRRRAELEAKFMSLEGGLDLPERQALWPQLAAVNAALGEADEAGVCWLHALWGEEAVSEGMAWQWFRAEAAAVRPELGSRANQSWASRISTAVGDGRDIAGDDLDRLLAVKEPFAADIRALAAYLVWAVRRQSPPQAIVQRLNGVQQFLEVHERLLPVRAVWLAWVHLVRLSGGDVLALARARDRLLERLFTDGLRPEQDLPGFLRFAGPAAADRFRGVGQWLRRMAERAHDWIGRQGLEPTAQGAPKTRAYSDLLFAFGLARLGEQAAAVELLHRAKAALTDEDDAHMLLFKGFEYRTQQVLAGKPHGGPLPPDQMEYLEHLRKTREPLPGLGYVVDALRGLSRVLEPHTRVDAYLFWYGNADMAERAELSRIADRDQLAERVRRLLQAAPKGGEGDRRRAAILWTALDEAPRAGEPFALELLEKTTPTFDVLMAASDPHALSMYLPPLISRALFVAAHFDAAEHVAPLVERFRALLRALHAGPGLREFTAVAGACFRGLRKLGLRDTIDQLLGETAGLIQGGRAPSDATARLDDAALCSLLHVAAGWLYFGRDRQAEPILQAAREILLRNDASLWPTQRAALAHAYVTALGQAHIETAQKRVEELFDRVELIRDAYVTHKWYCQAQLKVLECVVMAAAGDDFILGADARRWLDDDEYLVRRRVHADYRAAGGRGAENEQ